MKLRSQPGTGEREERVAQNTGNHRGAGGGGGRGKLKTRNRRIRGQPTTHGATRPGTHRGGGEGQPTPQGTTGGGGGYHVVGGGGGLAALHHIWAPTIIQRSRTR